MTTHDEDKIIAQQARIEQLTNFIKYAQVSSGVCCCGDSMEGHPSPMTCGHSPVDMWDYHSGELLEAYPDDLSALRAHDEKLRAVFQAGAASRDAEVAEHIEEITALKEVIKHGDAQRERDMELAGEERDQLRAQINVLRELVIHSTDYRLGNPAYEASIATTPEQSLFEYRNKVIEE